MNKYNQNMNKLMIKKKIKIKIKLKKLLINKTKITIIKINTLIKI